MANPAIQEITLQKSFSYVLPFEKDIDQTRRLIRGYASTEALDREGQVVAKKAISKALDEYMGVNPTIRADHKPPPIGTTIKAHIDHKGLFIHTQIFKNTQAAEDAWETILQGGYRAFSIGGLVRKAQRVFDKKLDAHVTKITELTLSEISITDAPANTQCLFEVLHKSIAPELEKKIGEWEDFDACVEHHMSDPEFEPKGDRTKREAAQALCAEIEQRAKEKDVEAQKMTDTEEIEKDGAGDAGAETPSLEERLAAVEKQLAEVTKQLAGSEDPTTPPEDASVTANIPPEFVKQFAEELRKELGITVTDTPTRKALQETNPALQDAPPKLEKESDLTIPEMLRKQHGVAEEEET